MTKPIRIIELFAGFGTQSLALKRLGVQFEHHFVCEFDKYAIASYNAVHGTNYPPLDVRDIHASDLKIVDKDKYDYLLTYSFPCVNLSQAGKKEGMTKGSGTRSGLLWEVERILKECGDNLPQFLMMENVPQIHDEKNIKDFGNWITFLDSLGYRSKWADLNAANFNVPQKRERCFMISYLDRHRRFEWPVPKPLEVKGLDLLENEVPEKFYLKYKSAEEIIKEILKQCKGVIPNDRVLVDLSTRETQITTIFNTLKAGSRGIVNFGGESGVLEYHSGALRLRRITPLESYRVMGVDDEDAKKMLAVNSATQCFKQAGNSIVVDVMVEIFRNLFLDGSENIPSQVEFADLL